MDRIRIPDLTELKPDHTTNGREMYNVCEVLDFYIRNNSLVYPLNNTGTTKRIQCIKNSNNIYKVFAYKTSGVLSHSVYFLLDTEKQTLYKYNGGSSASGTEVKKWAEYLLKGGSCEKAIAHNKLLENEFNPADF